MEKGVVRASLLTKEKQVQASFLTPATVLAFTTESKPSLFFSWKPSMEASMVFTPTHTPFHPTLDEVRKHIKGLLQCWKCMKMYLINYSSDKCVWMGRTSFINKK